MQPILDPYWQPKPREAARKEIVYFNTIVMSAEEKLDKLLMDRIGGVLLVTTVVEAE
jgi:hypothetical protein